MRGYCSIFLLSFLFVSIAILSGYKSESSSSGCNSPPEIVVSKPSENDNIENPPASVEFTAIQNSTDLTSIDLSKVTAIIRDNMNKALDISQYITNNCDFLKKNCNFKGEVNLSEGEYILEVRVCNTASMCDTKQVSFTVFPIKPDEWGDIIINWFKRFRCDYSLWANITNSGCNSTDDSDKDCIRDIAGCDNCPDVKNPDQADLDGDGIGDMCDDDIDEDGIDNSYDNCIYVNNPNQKDSDEDGKGDLCDEDIDGDKIKNESDNCPNIVNIYQADLDKDRKGDACDEDIDGDSVKNEEDNCPYIINPNQKNIPCLNDSDGDGLSDTFENRIGTDPNDADTDNDGLGDGDEFRFGGNPLNWDTNGDCISDLEEVLKGDGCNIVKKFFNIINIKKCEFEPVETPLEIPKGCKGRVNIEVPFKRDIDEYSLWVANIKVEYKREVFNSVCNLQFSIRDMDIIEFQKLVMVSGDVVDKRAKFISTYETEDNGLLVKEIESAQFGISYKGITCDDLDGCLNHREVIYKLRNNSFLIRGGNSNLIIQRDNDGEWVVTIGVATSKNDTQDCTAIEFEGGDWCGGEDEVCEQSEEYDGYVKDISESICESGLCKTTTTMYFNVKGSYPPAVKVKILDAYFANRENFFVSEYEVYSGDGWMEQIKLMMYFVPVKIERPKEGEKYVYGDDGKIEIGCKTNIKYSGMAGFTEESMRWGIDPVGDSHSLSSQYVRMNWEKKSSENRFEGKGNENKVVFTGLPLNNNDFGVKRVYLDVRGFNYFYNMALDNIWVKIFFPKEAKNHPYPSGSQPNTPNWYYYWSDALEVTGLHRYEDLDFEASTTVYSCNEWDIVIGRQASWADPLGNYPTGKRFIDGFVATNEHEFWHRDHRVYNYCTYNKYGDESEPLPIEVDPDRDGIDNNWEQMIGTDPNEFNSTEDGANYAESNPRYLRYGNKDIDWAYPGSQWE